MTKKVYVVFRTFQPKTGPNGEKEFDKNNFEKVAKSVRDLLLRSEKVIEKIIVVVNVEKGNSLAEGIYSNGQTPSTLALMEAFPEEIKSGRMIIHLCYNWGNNPGSGNALNEGIEIAQKMGAELAMCWSPEIEMNSRRIKEALRFMRKKNFFVVGFLRENWWSKTQWLLPQNTAAIWRIKELLSVGGFSPECNGTGKTVLTEEFGEVSLAGMEDFHAILKLFKMYPNFLFGMIGKSNPLIWDTDFPDGSERLLNHLKKVARHEFIMIEWSKIVFPYLSYNKVMDNLLTLFYLY